MKQKSKFISLFVVIFLLSVTAGGSSAQELGSAFTYQGHLTDGGSPANGEYDFQFALYSGEDGSSVGSVVTKENVTVTEGGFTVQLDFGNVFNGTPLLLEISVRPGSSSGDYTTLSPRQPLTPAPYALYAAHAPWSGLSNIPTGLDDGDDDTTYAGGTGLTLNGGTFSLVASYQLPQGCTSGQIAEWNGSVWVCGNDDLGSGGSSDHGTLTGLADDDHPQYFHLNQNETVSGRPAFDGGTSGSTPPFTVNSTQQVANLNADLLDGQHATAFAGTTHNHLGQTWNGSNNPLQIYGSFDVAPIILSNDNGEGLQVYSASNSGVYVNTVGRDGVHIGLAGNPSTYTASSWQNGVEVVGAQGNGLYVGRADQRGVDVYSAGGDGFYVCTTGAETSCSSHPENHGLEVGNAEHDGVHVSEAGADGVYVASAGGDGLYVNSAGDDGVHICATGSGSECTFDPDHHHGLEIGNSEHDGVNVISAGNDGIHVTEAAADGVYVASVGGDGLYVNSAGDDGVHICATGSGSECTFDPDHHHGLEIGNSEHDGVHIISAGNDGVYVHSAGNPSTSIAAGTPSGFAVGGSQNSGLYVGRADVHGVYINSAGGYGMHVNSAGGGLYVDSANYNGVYVHSSNDDGVLVETVGNPSVSIPSNRQNGLEVAGAQGFGLYVGRADVNGIEINSAGYDGIYVGSADRYAATLNGDVRVLGNLTKTSGSFKIDHPLDPENKYLNHSFVESPDMKNIYDGVVVLDTYGEAEITLPDWFQALNRDFRYQLTPVGGPGPGIYIAEEIQNNRFKIAGGEVGLKVCWQVTGIRQDPYAEANPIPVEEDKPIEEKGTYLHPEAYGQPETKGVIYQDAQNLALEAESEPEQATLIEQPVQPEAR